jgi:hypothetical protein
LKDILDKENLKQEKEKHIEKIKKETEELKKYIKK